MLSYADEVYLTDVVSPDLGSYPRRAHGMLLGVRISSINDYRSPDHTHDGACAVFSYICDAHNAHRDTFSIGCVLPSKHKHQILSSPCSFDCEAFSVLFTVKCRGLSFRAEQENTFLSFSYTDKGSCGVK